ncbi:MAG: hypothetical protein HFI42_03845 [Lachnospiraceae bacterium]|nr:hypothetical protein [Lachnospiraceae bacterium]
MKKVALLMLSVLTLSLFAGCGGKFDASAYVKALLDNSYKNDSAAFVEMKIGSAEEASELYEQGLDAEMQGVLAGVSMSEEAENNYRTFFKDLLAKADYKVGDAEKQSDGSYIVTVTYKQMKIFEPALTAYLAELESKTAEWQTQASEGSITEDEVYEQMYLLLLSHMQTALSSVEYGDEQTTTITVELVNNVYTPSDSDFYNLESLMFDVDAMSAM